MKMRFSSATQGGLVLDQTAVELIEIAKGHARASMNNLAGTNILINKYSTNFDGYTQNDSRALVTSIYKFCAGKTQGLINPDANWESADTIANALNNTNFTTAFFAIYIDSLNAINSVNEIRDSIQLANIDSVPLGGSKTYEIDTKALFKVQEGAYGDLQSVFQENLRSSLTLNSAPKILSIDFDPIQMLPINYDFGKSVAKVAASFRTKMYADIINAIYTIANVSSTVFYQPNFASTTYAEMAQRIAAANNAPVYAYGTNLAFRSMSNVVITGFTVQDEKIKNGFIADTYGVPQRVINQAVDSNTTSYTFRVPNNRVLLLSDIADRPIKMVKENYVYVIPEEGKEGVLYKRSYTMIDSWNVGYITQAAYGIQEV